MALKEAGVTVIGAIDVCKDALAVYSMNHCETVARIDLSKVDEAVAWIKGLGRRVDVLVGSPPCQDFSSSGARKEGPRASLTLSFAEIVARIRPKLFMVENVALFSNSTTFLVMQDMMRAAGYSLCVFTMNAKHCQVPQSRNRCFVVGVRGSVDLSNLLASSKARYAEVPASSVVQSTNIWFAARNATQPCVVPSSKPYPTIRSTCLAPPPRNYAARADDSGAVSDAYVLKAQDVALICSFHKDYLPPVIRTKVAGRLLGNCVPPKQALRVCKMALPYLRKTTREDIGGRVFSDKPVRETQRKSKMHLVLEGRSPHEMGARWTGHAPKILEYEFGSLATTDLIYENVFGWNFRPGWRLVIKERLSGKRQDDLLVYTPEFITPLRSKSQVMRLFKTP